MDEQGTQEARPRPTLKGDVVTVGSTWYLGGQHVKIVGRTTRDGQPALLLKAVHGRWHGSVIEERFMRKAVETQL